MHFDIFEHIHLCHHQHKVVDIKGKKLHIILWMDLQTCLISIFFHIHDLFIDQNNHPGTKDHMFLSKGWQMSGKYIHLSMIQYLCMRIRVYNQFCINYHRHKQNTAMGNNFNMILQFLMLTRQNILEHNYEKNSTHNMVLDRIAHKDKFQNQQLAQNNFLNIEFYIFLSHYQHNMDQNISVNNILYHHLHMYHLDTVLHIFYFFYQHSISLGMSMKDQQGFCICIVDLDYNHNYHRDIIRHIFLLMQIYLHNNFHVFNNNVIHKLKSIYQQIEVKCIFNYINDYHLHHHKNCQGIIVHMYKLNDLPIITIMQGMQEHMFEFYYQQTSHYGRNNPHIYVSSHLHINKAKSNIYSHTDSKCHLQTNPSNHIRLLLYIS